MKNIIIFLFVFIMNSNIFGLSPKTNLENSNTKISVLFGNDSYNFLIRNLINPQFVNVNSINKILETYNDKKDVYTATLPDYFKIGNVHSIVQRKKDSSGIVLLWKSLPNLNPNIYSKFMFFNEFVPELNACYRKNFETFLSFLNIKFEKDKSGCFYFIESDEALLKLEKLHNIVLPFIKDIVSEKSFTKNDIEIKIDSMLNEILFNFPLFKNDLFYVWYALSNYLREFIINDNVPLDYAKIRLYEVIDDKNNYDSSVYERVTLVFCCLAKSAYGDKLQSDINPYWAIYNAPNERIFEYISLMSDWFHNRKGDNINWFTSEALYSNYLLYEYILSIKFRTEYFNDLNHDDFKILYKSKFKEYLLKYFDLGSSYGHANSIEKTIARAFDAINVIKRLIKVQVRHVHILTNHIHQMDSSNFKTVINELRNEMKMIYEAVNECQNIFNKSKDKFIKFQSKKIVEKDKINETDENLIQLNKLWNNRLNLNELLRNLECMLVIFISGELYKTDIKDNFGGLLDGIGPNKFYNLRFFSPDRVNYKNYSDKNDERYRNNYSRRLSFLEESISSVEAHGLYSRENARKTYFNFLFPIDQRLFKCFYFWDFDYNKDNEKNHINFLNDVIKNDDYHAHFASLLLMYYYLLKDAKSGKYADIKSENFNSAMFYFKSAFDNIERAIKARNKKLSHDDSGYYHDFSNFYLDEKDQEVNRLISFFYIVFTENINTMKIPNSVIHKHDNSISFINEILLLKTAIEREVNSKDVIDWGNILKMFKFVMSISMQPSLKDLNDCFQLLMKSNIPDEVLEKFLKSLIFENHKFSLIYASFISDLVVREAYLTKKYLKTLAVCNDHLSKQYSMNLTQLCHLANYYLENNKNFLVGKLLCKISEKMPEGFNSDSNFKEFFNKISLKVDIDAIEPIFNLLKEVITIEKFLKEGAYFFVKKILESEVIDLEGDDFIEILDEQPKTILESDSYKNSPINVRERIEGIIFELEEDKFLKKITFYFLVQEFSKVNFEYKRSQKESANQIFNQYLNSKYQILNFIIITINLLKHDALFDKDNKLSNQDIHNSFLELDEILDFFLHLVEISNALNDKKYFTLTDKLSQFKGRFNILNFSFNNEIKKNQNIKKMKKQKEVTKQNIPKIFKSFPKSFIDEVLILLRSAEKQALQIDNDDMPLKQKIKDIVEKIYKLGIKTGNDAFIDIENDAFFISEMLKLKPYLFEVNFFDDNKESELFIYYREIINSKGILLLSDLNDYKNEVLTLKEKYFVLFEKINKKSKKDINKINELFNVLKQIKQKDTKTFEKIITETSAFLKGEYLKLEPFVIENLSQYYDNKNNNVNHNTLSFSQYEKTDFLHFFSSEFLKWIHIENYYEKSLLNKLLIDIERVEYLTHAALVINILKINRLNLSAKYKVEEILREETQDAFKRQIQSIKIDNGYDNLRQYEGDILITPKKDEFVLSIESLCDFMDIDTKSQKKYDKAKRIFKSGSRFLFFRIKDTKEPLKISSEGVEKSIPVFELTEVAKGENGESGVLRFTLINREDFPLNISNEEIIKTYLPKKQNGYKTYFLIKDSYDIRDRYLFFDKLLFDLLYNGDRKFTFSTFEQVELSRDFPNFLILNTALGLYSSQKKHEIEKQNNYREEVELSDDDIISEEKIEIFNKMQNISIENEGHNINWINAPGGTGKTYFAKYLINHLIKQIKGFIFICTPTHRAVDKVIIDIVYSGNEEEVLLKSKSVRVANMEVKEKITPIIRKEIWDIRDEILKNVIQTKSGLFFSTSTGFNGDSVIREVRKKIVNDTGKDIFKGEYIIYDEAGNDSYENFLYFLHQQGNDKTKVLVLGDVLQLGPFGMSEQEKNDIFDVLSQHNLIKNFEGVNLSSTLLSNYYQYTLQTSPLQEFHGAFGFKRHYLTENRRSGRAIVEILNETGYDKYSKGMVSCVNEKVPYREQVKFIDAYDSRRNELKRGRDGKILFGEHINFKEIQKLLIELDKDFYDYPFMKGGDVSFISPYKAQNELFRLSVTAFAVYSELLSIEKYDFLKIQDLSMKIKLCLNDLNELISTYGGKNKILIPPSYLNSSSLSLSDLKEIKLHLKDNLPWFIPRYAKAVNLEKISKIDMVNITDIINDKDESENGLSDIDISTIHKKQGGQNFAVYFSAVRRNNEGIVGFMEDKNGPRMLHVAFGRAEQILRVAASYSTWEKLRNRVIQNNTLYEKSRVKYREEASFIMTKAFETANLIKTNNKGDIRFINKSRDTDIAA